MKQWQRQLHNGVGVFVCPSVEAAVSAVILKTRRRHACHHSIGFGTRSAVEVDWLFLKTILWWQACRLRVLRITADTAASTEGQTKTPTPLWSCRCHCFIFGS